MQPKVVMYVLVWRVGPPGVFADLMSVFLCLTVRQAENIEETS
jgi:hypothetical protein